MRNVESIVASIVIGLLIYLWFRGKEMRLGRQLSFVTYSKERKEKCDAFLVTQHASYYNLLSAKNRLTFVNRTLFILDEKTFIEREGFLFTEERKMKIAATLVQLTFGLGSEFADLSSFEFIVIYPSKFFSKLIGTDVKGLAVSNVKFF